MTQTRDGFKIAEEDLRLRGPGEFYAPTEAECPNSYRRHRTYMEFLTEPERPRSSASNPTRRLCPSQNAPCSAP